MKKTKKLVSTIICIMITFTILLTNVTIYSATEREENLILNDYQVNAFEEEKEITIGDINGDGSINSTDYILLRRYILNIITEFPTSHGHIAADLNGDGNINSTDVILMRRYILNIIDEFPASRVKVESPKEINISLENHPTKKGDIITASININEISNLAGYQLNIKYDPKVLQPVDCITKNPYEEDTIPSIGNVLSDTNHQYVSAAYHDLEEGRINFGRVVKSIDQFINNESIVKTGELAKISFEVLKLKDTKIEFINDKDNKYWRANAYIEKKGVQLFDSKGECIDTKGIKKVGTSISTVSASSFELAPIDKDELQALSLELEDIQEHTIEGYIETSNPQGFNVEVYNDEKDVIESVSTNEEGYFKFKYTPDSNEVVTVKISKEGYLSRLINIPVGMKGVQIGSKNSPLNMWIGETNGDYIIDMKDIMEIIKNSDEEKLQKALDNFNRVPDDYLLEKTLTSNTDNINSDIEVLKNTVFDLNRKILSGNNIRNAGNIYLRGGEISLRGVYEQRKNVLSTQRPLIDMQNGKMEVRANVIMDGGIMNINGGNLHVKGEYQLKNNAILKMTRINDHVIIEGSTFVYTQTSYDNCLTAGILELRGDFTVNGTPNNNIFEAYGSHKTVLAGERGQTINMENGHRPHMFNTLILLEPEDHYNFIPPNKEFWKQMLDYIPVIPTEPEAPHLTGVWHNNTVRLYWSKTNCADRYNVYRSSVDKGPYYLIEENRLRKDFIDVDVKEGNTYYYVVEAVNRFGTSPYSQQVKVNSGIVYDIESIDLDADYSGNGLTNREELKHGTNPFKWDTDEDGISDYDEIYVYGTHPLNPDTSGDGIYDGAAVMLGLNPLDYHEDVVSFKTALSRDERVEVTAWGNGNVIMSPLQVWDSDNILLNNLEGIVGKPVEITNGGFPIEYAEIRISYNREDLGDISEDELTIFYANPETQQLEEIDDVRVDKVNQVVIGITTHFSPFLLGPISMNRYLTSDIVFVIDQSGSMRTYDPNNIRINATKMFVERSFGAQRIGIVEFTDNGKVMKELTNEKETLLNKLNEMYISGGHTNITDGLRKAGGLFDENSNRQKVIVLLTDGESNREAGQEMNMARELAKQGIVINTIALGRDVDLDLMRAISKEANGNFFFIENQRGLSQEDVDRQTSQVYLRLLNMLSIISSRRTSSRNNTPAGVPHVNDDTALPDPWNIRLIDGEFWETKVEIRQWVNTELPKIESPIIKTEGKYDSYISEEINVDTATIFNNLLNKLGKNRRLTIGELGISDEMFEELFLVRDEYKNKYHPNSDEIMGGLEKKFYHEPTSNYGKYHNGYVFHILTQEIAFGRTVTHIIHGRYIMNAESRDEISMQLSVINNYQVIYDPTLRTVETIANRGLRFESIKMAIQLDTEKRNVFYESNLYGVFSNKKDSKNYELLIPVAKRIPYLKDVIETGEMIKDIVTDVWEFIKLFDTEGGRMSETIRDNQLGQSQSYGSKSYFMQEDDYESRGWDPVQIIWGNSKKFLSHGDGSDGGDRMKLKGGIGHADSPEDDYEAYFILDYSVNIIY
ncbi:UNVERIFIED_CONTAM: Mg-chelatase subunit ChlD [Acetivibrio alkalicellulosi]